MTSPESVGREASPGGRAATVPRPRLDARVGRALNLALLAGAALVLAVAAWLEPSPSGHSTHTQLGLAPCTFLSLSGIPCPMCGATTTFALMADGRWLEAFVNQPFAATLFLVDLGILGLAGSELVRPADRWIRVGSALDGREGWVGASILVLMSGAWIWKITQVWI